MALQIVSDSKVGEYLDLNEGDDAFVAPGAILLNSGPAIIVEGSEQKVFIGGTVHAELGGVDGISLGNEDSLDHGNTLYVSRTGSVIANKSVTMEGYDSRVINDGLIRGDAVAGYSGVGIFVINLANSNFRSSIVNTGTIEAADHAIYHFGDSTETLVIENYGVIKGAQHSFKSNFAAAAAYIYNYGVMSGDIFFGSGDDVYDGARGTLSGWVRGDIGSDILVGGKGSDHLQGEGGYDDLALGDPDQLWGGGGNDELYGNGGNDVLNGDAGIDTLHGGHGADSLNGGPSSDILTGGEHADKFIFNTKLGSANRDKITDFVHNLDDILLENAVFKGLKAGGLSAQAFYAGAKAHDADDRIIYNKATGALFYDADGLSGQAQIQFAAVAKNLVLTVSDFQAI